MLHQPANAVCRRNHGEWYLHVHRHHGAIAPQKRYWDKYQELVAMMAVEGQGQCYHESRVEELMVVVPHTAPDEMCCYSLTVDRYDCKTGKKPPVVLGNYSQHSCIHRTIEEGCHLLGDFHCFQSAVEFKINKSGNRKNLISDHITNLRTQLDIPYKIADFD